MFEILLLPISMKNETQRRRSSSVSMRVATEGSLGFTCPAMIRHITTDGGLSTQTPVTLSHDVLSRFIPTLWFSISLMLAGAIS